MLAYILRILAKIKLNKLKKKRFEKLPIVDETNSGDASILGQKQMNSVKIGLKNKGKGPGKNLASKTAEETRILKQENNRKQRERRSAETSNQKFWRLLRRRQYDKFGLHMNCIDFEYHRSKHQYGIDIDFASENDEFVVGVSEVGMKTVFSVFFDMIDLAIAGRTIPLESFKMFDHYGIYMPKNFFTNYMDDLSYYKLTP